MIDQIPFKERAELARYATHRGLAEEDVFQAFRIMQDFQTWSHMDMKREKIGTPENQEHLAYQIREERNEYR